MPWMAKDGKAQRIIDGTQEWWRNKGYLPDSDGDGIPDQNNDAALSAADAAMAAAQNARNMVLTRDPAMAAVQAAQTQLSALASSYETALGASVTDRTALHAALDGLSASLAALSAQVAAAPIVRTGTASVTAALLAGATRDVVVTLGTKMPNATYSAGAWVNGGTSLLGQTQLVGIVGQTDTTVTVQIKNIGLASIASAALSVSVIAVK